MKILEIRRAPLAAVVLALGAATLPSVPAAQSAAEFDRLAREAIERSFREQGQAKLSWLDQDAALKACSSPTPPSADVLRPIEQAALAGVKWPADGKYLGDWKAGERIAQSGRGMTWTDKPDAAAGGGCYNCHQLSKEEISFGTIGPSLYHFGKLRGVANPADPVSEPIVRYTWVKLYNAKAYNACSSMPRMGHSGILTEKQLKDLMALLLDPASPVNQ